jgi:YidC/Oxa1 family membrane protein insertase
LSQKPDVQSTDDVVLVAKSEIAIGKPVTVKVQNNTSADLALPAFCPNSPLKVERYLNGEWTVIDAQAKNCKPELFTVASKKSQQINYAPWNQQLFKELGKYRISLDQTVDGKVKTYSKEINIVPAGIFTKMFREVFYKPIFNTLIFLISFQPGHSLGWAIIMLTIIIKLILLVPNQKALKAQKQMQKVQPQLDALKKKHKDNPQLLAEETMLIWKKYKVNPMSSCLPMLLQFPVLIALFYVVKDGLGFINPDLLYGSLKTFDAASINTIFLGIIDLTKVNVVVLPIAIGLLQFAQMRMALGKSMAGASDSSPMPMMNKTMIYVMPLMIAFFTASLPAAVGFYWGTSTLFGIAQQFVVNRSKD